MPDVGDMAPDFDLIDHNQQQVTLSQFRGSKNVVLSYHTASFTGG